MEIPVHNMQQNNDSSLIMVRFEKFKNWHEAENVLCRDIVPTGGTAGHLGQNRDCPAEIGTVDMSVPWNLIPFCLIQENQDTLCPSKGFDLTLYMMCRT